jgi:hypothetical protein
MSVLEGVYAMYYSYAETQCQHLLQCEQWLVPLYITLAF